MDVLYIFPWKIKPTNSMQSIACIMVVNARCTLPALYFGEAAAADCPNGERHPVHLVGFNTHTFLLPIFVIRKKGFVQLLVLLFA